MRPSHRYDREPAPREQEQPRLWAPSPSEWPMEDPTKPESDDTDTEQRVIVIEI